MQAKSYLIVLLLSTFCLLTSHAQQYGEFNNFGGKTNHLCVRGVLQTEDGMVWMAAESGLYSFDGYHLQKHPLMAENGKERRGLGSYNSLKHCGDSLWVQTNGGLLTFDLSVCRYTAFDSTKAVDVSYDEFKEKPTALLKSEGIEWRGSSKDLKLILGDKCTETWAMPYVKALCRDNFGQILVGTDDGMFVVRHDHSVRQIKHDARNTLSLAGDAVWSIYNAPSRDIFVGTNCGLSVSPYNRRLQNYSLSSITGEGMGNQFHLVFIDSKERYWLGGPHGLLCIEHLGLDNQHCRWYRMGDEKYPLVHNRVRVIRELSDGTLLFGGDGGFAIYNESTQQMDHCPIEPDPYNWVYDIRIKPESRLEITTYSADYLVEMDLPNRRLNVLEQRERYIVPNFGKRLLRKLGLADNYLSAYEDTLHHKVLLGGLDGFAVLNKEIEDVDTRPLSITGLLLDGSEYINATRMESKCTVIPADCRYVDIFFSDFIYGSQMPTSYEYSLDGEEWMPLVGEEHTVRLVHLGYGIHHLCIRSANGRYETHLDLDVDTPWRDTWWAQGLAVLAVILIVVAIFWIVRQRQRILRDEIERLSIITDARQKQEKLQSEKEHLSNQLKVQHLSSNKEESAEEGLSDNEQFLLRVTNIIEENIDCEDLDVAKLSELCNVHQKQLYRKIKDLTGMTTVAYIRSLRLKKAASLLKKGDLTVSEVMYRTGFSSPSYFARSFQEEYGKSPSEWIGGSDPDPIEEGGLTD